MIFSIHTIYLVEHCVDLRKSFDGLAREAQILGIDLHEGEAAVFVSRNKRLLKLLRADKTGLILTQKRFNRGVPGAKINFLDNVDSKEITQAELMQLFEGGESQFHPRERK